MNECREAALHWMVTSGIDITAAFALLFFYLGHGCSPLLSRAGDKIRERILQLKRRISAAPKN